MPYPKPDHNSLSRSLVNIFFIGSIPFLICYFLFFAFHKQIIQINRPSDAMISLVDAHFFPSLRNQHDGIEPNILFLIFLLIGPAGFLLYKSRYSSKILMGIGLALWLIFIIELSFFQSIYHKLFSGIMHWRNCITLLLSFLAIVTLWRWIYNKYFFVAWMLLIAILTLVCIVPSADNIPWDYAYLLAPPLKLLQGGGISNTYFQYDFLPSIPAWFVIKCGGSVYDYRYVIQSSYLVFIIAAFIMARKFFINKGLAFYLLALLIIVRGMLITPVEAYPQTSPIRLDWWLFLFICSYFWGIDNFKFGIGILLLLVLLNSLGTIYLICYLLFLGFIFLYRLYNNYVQNGSISFSDTISNWLKSYLPNIGLGLSGLLVFWLITGHIINESISLYKAYQFGFMPIAHDSNLWYFASIFSFCFTLLLIFKKRFTNSYWNSAMLLLFLCVGNSMYFFGRSREQNIPFISGAWLFVAALCSDVLLQLFRSEGPNLKIRHKLIALSPIGLILIVVIITYSDRFVDNIYILKDTYKSRGWEHQEAFPPKSDLTTIANLTSSSKKVYFMTYSKNIDFYFYYYGHYTMPTKFIPIEGWLLTTEKIEFANKELNSGYYIIALANDSIFKKDFLPKLNYKKMNVQNGYMALSNYP
jgi:hypothetical protein